MKVTGCLKLVSTFYSFLALGGGATAGFGIWSQITKKPSEVLTTVDGTTFTKILSMGAPLLIALGCIFALMGLIGFCGTLKKKSWMLLVFFIVVLIIFILQVIAAVFILLPYSVKENALSSLKEKFVESLEKKYGQDPSFTRIWNETMTNLKCCGYKGYEDFTSSAFVKENSNYPKQCCSNDPHLLCGKDKAKGEEIRGCIHVLFDENIPISGALSFLIGIIEIVALIVSLKVYQCLRRLPDLTDPYENNL
ncbi:tetraspanin-1-like [Carassius carassius]|uniref:tetraspanin-1-like n=1 Tax=Carassius carassius TaxID=217509 RepID=UPI002868AE8A|nr:tetraspanin-1-like [Carassius carassius]